MKELQEVRWEILNRLYRMVELTEHIQSMILIRGDTYHFKADYLGELNNA